MDKCPDCRGDLEKGCLIDQAYGAVTVQKYARSEIPDTPNKGIIGFSEEKFYDLRKVIAHRCKKCNRIFLHALNTIIIPNLSLRIKRHFLYVAIFCIGVIVIIAIIIALVESY